MRDPRPHMQRALDLAAKGLGRTSPNPLVGCVLVRGRTVVGEGYHRRFGGHHAEVEAIRSAGNKARGATAYVNLEPCDHHGKTPPCSGALIEAGVRRVVVGTRDPNPAVQGRGIRRLRAAGIEVVVGCLPAACRALNAPYFIWRAHGVPWVTLKLAQSLDGRVATRTGASQWITGPEARRHGHVLRGQHDAILVGIGTVRADDPQLTCRVRGGRDPMRVILDRQAATPPDAAVLRAAATSRAPTVVLVSPNAPKTRRARLTAAGAEVIAEGTDPATVCRILGSRGVLSLLVEGGPTVASAFLRDGCINAANVYQAPCLLGGQGALGSTHALAMDTLDEAPRGRIESVTRLGEDVLTRLLFHREYEA